MINEMLTINYWIITLVSIYLYIAVDVNKKYNKKSVIFLYCK